MSEVFPVKKSRTKRLRLAGSSKNPNKSLFQLTVEAQSLVAAIVGSGGELTPEIEARLAGNEVALSKKVDGYVYIEGQIEVQCELLKRKEEGLHRVRKGLEAFQERLRSNVKVAMKTLDKTELTGDEYTYKLGKGGEKLVIDDESQIPHDFKMIVTTTVVDKERVTQALKDGFEVKGARLEEYQKLLTREAEEKE